MGLKEATRRLIGAVKDEAVQMKGVGENLAAACAVAEEELTEQEALAAPQQVGHEVEITPPIWVFGSTQDPVESVGKAERIAELEDYARTLTDAARALVEKLYGAPGKLPETERVKSLTRFSTLRLPGMGRDYWRDKAKEHQKAAHVAGKALEEMRDVTCYKLREERDTAQRKLAEAEGKLILQSTHLHFDSLGAAEGRARNAERRAEVAEHQCIELARQLEEATALKPTQFVIHGSFKALEELQDRTETAEMQLESALADGESYLQQAQRDNEAKLAAQHACEVAQEEARRLRGERDTLRNLRGTSREVQYFEQGIADDGRRAGIDTRGLVGMAIVHLMVERIQELEANQRDLCRARAIDVDTLSAALSKVTDERDEVQGCNRNQTAMIKSMQRQLAEHDMTTLSKTHTKTKLRLAAREREITGLQKTNRELGEELGKLVADRKCLRTMLFQLLRAARAYLMPGRRTREERKALSESVTLAAIEVTRC